MKNDFELAVEALEQKLRLTGDDYQLIDKPSPDQCRVRFIGVFNEQPVVWDVRIRTLKDYGNEFKQSHGLDEVRTRQFIEIEQANACYRALVVLKLDEINTAAIGRTIIMIRKYKRLHLGRHEYGDPVIF